MEEKMLKLFTSTEYENDPVYQELMFNWKKYLNSNEDDEEFLTLWEEVLMNDWYTASTNWLKIFRNDDTWRKNLV